MIDVDLKFLCFCFGGTDVFDDVGFVQREVEVGTYFVEDELKGGRDVVTLCFGRCLELVYGAAGSFKRSIIQLIAYFTAVA